MLYTREVGGEGEGGRGRGGVYAIYKEYMSHCRVVKEGLTPC